MIGELINCLSTALTSPKGIPFPFFFLLLTYYRALSDSRVRYVWSRYFNCGLYPIIKEETRITVSFFKERSC